MNAARPVADGDLQAHAVAWLVIQASRALDQYDRTGTTDQTTRTVLLTRIETLQEAARYIGALGCATSEAHHDRMA